MQIRIVTLEREYGSGGAVIAKRIAQKLGWKLWDEELTAEIARLAKVDQRRPSGATKGGTRSPTACSKFMLAAATSERFQLKVRRRAASTRIKWSQCCIRLLKTWRLAGIQ